MTVAITETMTVAMTETDEVAVAVPANVRTTYSSFVCVQP